MRYGLRQMAGDGRFVELSSDEYKSAKAARRMLYDVVYIEQKFRLLLMNYAEFEQELLRLTNHHMIFHRVTWGSMSDDRYEISRRLINLLTTARLYVDQVKHDIKRVYGRKSSQFEITEKALSDQYDACLGYRAMEAMRNFVQHQGLPLHGISYNNSRVDSKKGDQFLSTCTPYISVKALEKEGGFKSTVLQELRTCDRGDEFDVKPLVRQYVTGLANAHKAIRKVYEADVLKAEETFSQTRQKFVAAHGDVPAIALVEEEPDEEVVSELHLVPDLIERRKELAIVVGNFRDMYATSQAAEDIPR